MAFALDLRNVLEGRPIAARPASSVYRIRKFVRRHRTGSLAAVAIVAVVLGGTATTLWQARETGRARVVAEEEALRSRQVTAMMTDIFRLADPTRTLGDTIGVRQVLAQGATRIEAGLGEDPELQASLLLEVGRVYENLGILDEAERLAERALAIREANEPGSLAHAEALGFSGLVARTAGRPAVAIPQLEEAIRLRSSLIAEPDTALATLMAGLGWEVRAQGDHPRALELFEEALEVQRSLLGDSHPVIASTMMGLAATLHDQGSFDEAEALFRSAIDRGVGDRPDPVAASALVNLGMLRRLREEYRESEPLLKSGLEMRLALFDPEHPDVIIAREQWAQSLAALGRYAEARAVFIEALEWGIPVVGTNHPDIRSVREGLASVERALGEYDQAFARLDTVRGHKIEALGDSHPGVVVTLIYMGEIALRAGRLDTSEELFDEALGMGGDLGEPEGVYASLAITGLTEIALEQGDLAKAQSLYATAEAISSDALRPGHRYRLELQRVGAQVHMATGRPDLAVELLRGVRMAEEAVRPTPHPRLGETDLLLGRALAALGELEEARTAYRSALAEFAALPDGHPARVEALAGIADPGTGVTGAPAR